MRLSFQLPFFSLLVVVALGCVSAEVATGPVEPGTGLAFETAVLEAKDGRTALQLESEKDQVVLLDANATVIARYRIAPDRIEVSDGSGNVVAELRMAATEFVLSGRRPNEHLLRLTREPDGDLELELDGSRHVKFKARDYGYKLVDAEGDTLGKVRRGKERISVRNKKGEKVRSTRAPLSAASVACLVIPDIELAEAGGFSVALAVWGLPL